MTSQLQSPNLLDPDTPSLDCSEPSRRRRTLQRILRIVRTTLISSVVLFLVLAWTTRSSDPNVLIAIRDSAAIRTIGSLLRSPSSTLEGERDDRISFLLLGMRGEGTDGPLLTDTILIASVKPSTHHATLISIPRDLLVPLPNGTSQKVNAINAYAEEAGRDGGDAVRGVLENILDIPLPYYVRVDFAGFVGLVEALGGVTVRVERTLDDPQFPIPGKENAPWEERFEHVVIPAGPQRLDGKRALQYVRSRHALGVEGSDFARARRQQRLLLGIRDRIIDAGLGNPRYLLALLDTWRNHIETNLSPPELVRLSSFASSLTTEDVTRIVFTDAPDGELVARIVQGAYVLQPRNGSFTQLHEVIARAFAGAIDTATTHIPNHYAVEIWNGTSIEGLAAQTASTLTDQGFVITGIRNAPTRTVERTVIYRKPSVPDDVIDRLQGAFDAYTSTSFPTIVTATTEPDILIILGTETPHPTDIQRNTHTGGGET